MSSPARTLQELIDKAMIKHQVKSSNALAKLGKERGYDINRTTLAEMRRGAYPWTPSDATIEMLAKLAGVSREEAYAAADMGDPGEPYQPPAGAKHLTAKQREVVDTVIRALVEASQAQETHRAERANEMPVQITEDDDSIAYLTAEDLNGPDELNRPG